MEALHVVVTMDCEKPNDSGIAAASGPASWSDSARFIEQYASTARLYGFPVSFFIHPEVARPHRDLFLELERAGASIDGLHLHPCKYDPVRHRQHLGHMDEASQRAIIARAMGDWSAGLGRRPHYFRPGTFSANDATFRVATDLGFIGGSLSVPGRIFPDIGAVWSGCPADPHLAHGEFRIWPGRLAFANMPLTVDFSETRRRGVRSWHPDLRPDQSYADVRLQVARVVAQILARAPAIAVLNIVTHNDNDYGNADHPTRRNLEAILLSVREAAEQGGIACRGATINEICAMVFDLNPMPPAFVAV